MPMPAMSFARYRERQETDVLKAAIRIDSNGSQFSENYRAQLSYDRMWDTPTENYWALKEAGAVLPVNPLQVSSLQATCSPGLWDASIPSPPYSVSGNRNMGPSPDDLANYFPVIPDSSYIEGHLLKKAQARAKDPDLDLLTSAAELSKTVSLFTDAARNFKDRTVRMAKAADRKAHNSRKGVKRKKRGDSLALTRYKIFSDMWLEGRYGWRLAYYDALSIAEAIEHSGRLFNRGWATHSETIIDSGSKVLSGGAGSAKTTWTFETKYTVRAGTLFEVNLEKLPNIGISPAITAWELIPYSFVVDWFIDVGDSIAALSPRPSMTARNYWLSTRWETEITNVESEVLSITAPYTSLLVYPNDLVGSKFFYQRWPTTGDSIDFTPKVELSFDWAKALDGVALLKGGKRIVQGILNRG